MTWYEKKETVILNLN